MALVLALCALSGYSFANADTLIGINFANFPDDAFRQVIADYYDLNEDGYLNEAEIAAITTIPLTAYAEFEIETLKGIENFTSLKSLYAGDLGIEDASDLEGLTSLQTLVINGNNLTSLDISGNTALKTLKCMANSNLTTLTLNTAIEDLQCDNCSIAAMNLSACTNLKKLICHNNELTELNLLTNINLVELNCAANHLASLDLSGNSLLREVTTNYMVGDQTVSASATFVGKDLYIPYNNVIYNKLMNSNIPNPDPDADEEELYTGYDNNVKAFKFTEYELLETGIIYEYDVSAGDSEYMSVHVSVDKNFYRVTYSTAQNGMLIDYNYVNSGGSSTAPDLPEMPDGAVCGSWSGATTNVTEDRDLYPVWNSQHQYALTSFANHIASGTCTCCGMGTVARFDDCINAVSGDANYYLMLDANLDGVINARDLSILLNKN